MKIVYLAAGAGGMYCGSCLHDNTLAAALLRLGEDVTLLPTYTPIRTDEEDVSEPRVMFGGINVYLQQKSAIFRHTPWFVDGLLDRPALIDWLARHALSTDASTLGALTVSMLRGEEGNQRKEVEKLVYWLEHEAKPDVVHLSNSMLVGMASEIHRRLGVPVVCTLSGEDIFLDKLLPPWRERAWDALRERVHDITAFVALNHYYADHMTDVLGIDPELIHVIPHGLKLAGHGTRHRPSDRREAVIGFFARICHDKGLHYLAEALILLAKDPQVPPVVVRAAGYLGKSDRPYLEQVQARLASAGLADRFEYVGELDRAQKIEFLQSLDVMSIPTVYRESKGLSILEAWANAVPLVLPAHGTFPELIDDTGGGLLHAPDDPRALADALKQMLLDPQMAEACGRTAQRAVHSRYNDDTMARRTLDLYQRLVEGQRPATAHAAP